MKEAAYSLGPILSEEAVALITKAATEQMLRRPADNLGRFTYGQFSAGSQLRRETAYATVVGSHALPVIQAIAADPAICDAVGRFLGYRPRQVSSWLFWSFANGLSDDERRGVHQTIDYHYDVDGYNFMYANFYLLDTNARNGAHALIATSNTRKRLRDLFGASRLSDSDARRVYGREAERVLEGPAGFGFLEDTSCYHKALAPLDGDRLMLQLRYR